MSEAPKHKNKGPVGGRDVIQNQLEDFCVSKQQDARDRGWIRAGLWKHDQLDIKLNRKSDCMYSYIPSCMKYGEDRSYIVCKHFPGLHSHACYGTDEYIRSCWCPRDGKYWYKQIHPACPSRTNTDPLETALAGLLLCDYNIMACRICINRLGAKSIII